MPFVKKNGWEILQHSEKKVSTRHAQKPISVMLWPITDKMQILKFSIILSKQIQINKLNIKSTVLKAPC